MAAPPLPSPPHCHLPQINSNLSHSTEQLLVLAGFALSVSWPVQELERREICIFSNIHSGPSDTVGVQSIGALPPPETIVFLTQVLPCQCRDIALGHGVRGQRTWDRGQGTEDRGHTGTGDKGHRVWERGQRTRIWDRDLNAQWRHSDNLITMRQRPTE